MLNGSSSPGSHSDTMPERTQKKKTKRNNGQSALLLVVLELLFQELPYFCL